jgi:ribosome-associated protein YbcJ (S4-like RNA binding protein)
MATTRLTGTLIKSGSIPTTALGGGVVTSSAQIAGLVPGGTVSSSAQVDITATTNYSTFSSSLSTVDARQQVSLDALNSATSSYAINATIQSQLAGVASSSSQVKEYLPLGTISASNQIDITATTNYATFSSSIATKNDTQDISISALNAATSSYALQTQLAGVASSSTQVKTYLPVDTVSSSTQVVAFLPTGTVSSSAQYPGWVTSSTQITEALPTGTVSSSAQYPGWVTASSQIDYNSITNKLSGVVSSSEQIQPLLPTNTVSSSAQVTTFLPDGTVSSSAQYPGWVTASSQIDYNSITNKLSGVVSSSTQVQPLLPDGTVSSSGQVSITATSGYSTFSSSIATKNDTQDISINALNAATSSYAINSTIQSQLAGVVSSSTQVQPLLPGGTVSSSVLASPSQGTVRLTTNGAVTDVDTGLQVGDTPLFTGLNTSGSIQLASNGQIRILNNNENTLFGFFDGSTILGAYYQMWGNNHASTNQRGTAEFVFDTRNNGGGFIIAEFDGATFTRRLAVDRTGVTSVTGSLEVVGPVIGSFTGSILAPGVVSSSTQVVQSLPNGTVSASGQVDITATTGYSTFSSSIATKNDTQDISINALNAATSSYAINATIQSQLAGVASSSSQVKAYLPDGTVSSSGQVDITTTSGYSTFSSSLATVDATQQVSINALNAATSSYAINATIQSQLAGVASSSAQVKAYLPDGTVSSSGQVDYNSITNKLSGVVSSSEQVKPLLPGGTISSSTQVNDILDADGVFSSSAQVIVQNTTGIGAIATTGSNTFQGNQTISGSLFISQNLTVLGSSSITYLSQSTLNVETNLITVNAQNPSARFGGLAIIDSGSSPLRSGSILFDSVKDEPVFVHQSAGQTSSVFLLGPETYGDLGNEIYLTSNKVPKSQGNEHLIDSQITDNGVTVSITNGLSVGTNLTASSATISGLTANQAVFTDANDTLVSVATTGTGDVVRAGSPTITGTLTATNITATGTMLLAGIYSSSTQVDYNNIQNKLSGVVSSSAQVQPLLPGGTVSSSAQYPGWVTASSQIDYNSITNKLSGVVSSSTQVQPLLPGGTVSSSGQVTITSTTGYSTFSSSIATKNDVQDVSINSLNAATSSYAINSTIQSQLAGVVSSSAQVKPLLPGGTVTSSAQYPGWVTASSQIDYNSITNKLSGVYSSSAFSAPSQGTARLTLNGVALTDVDLGLQTTDGPTFAGMVSTAIISGSGTSYRLVVPVGTNYYAT